MVGSGQDQNTDSSGIILQVIAVHYRSALKIAVLAAAMVLVVGAVYVLWGQPVQRFSVLEFRPTFDGADIGEYPNGLAFSSSDVAAGAIVDLVYDVNEIEQYKCSREAFRGGFFVEQRSALSASLDAEYQGRLADIRLSGVERQQLQAEYQSKRASLPLQYRLVFAQPQACSGIPPMIVSKSLTDVLTTWAHESETRKGVLNHQVDVLSPTMLDGDASDSGLLRADLLRTSLWRVIDNIDQVLEIPGAGLVRLKGPDATFGVSFLEVRNKLTDLARSSLEPLVVAAGQSMVRESLAWVTETSSNAERTRKAAESRAAAYSDALREYSGLSPATPTARGSVTQSPLNSNDVQTVSPQIDLSFIDRIIEMSGANTAFKRELTTSMVEATVEAVAAEERAAYYRRLLESLRETGGRRMTAEEIDASLKSIVERGKFLTQQFNDLYAEFSRVSLRAAASLYHADKPVTSEVYRAVSMRSLLMLVVAAFFVALVLGFGYLFIRDRATVVVRGARP